VRRFWRRNSDLEARLLALGPEPDEEFVTRLAAHVRAQSPRPRRAPRYALAASLTAALVVSLGVFGGFGYAASAVVHVAQALHVVSKPGAPQLQTFHATAASSQYGPDCEALHAKLNAHQKHEKAVLRHRQAEETAAAKKRHAGPQELAALNKRHAKQWKKLAAHQKAERKHLKEICP
jgi:hypothetical protein